MPVYPNSFRSPKESQKFVLFRPIFYLFLIKILKTNLPFSVLWSLPFMKHIKRVSNWFILAHLTLNLEFVNLNHVTYTQPIWVALNIMLIAK